MSVSDLADPRPWPAEPAGDARAADLHLSAQAAIEASTRREADAFDARARGWLACALRESRGGDLDNALTMVPCAAVARHLRRLLAGVERGDPKSHAHLHTRLFALPVILVAALEHDAQSVSLAGVIPAPSLAGTLREARAFGGCETFALSTSLVAADAIDIAALPALVSHASAGPGESAGEFAAAPLDLPPSPIDVESAVERVHLRFIAGAVLTPPHVDPLREPGIDRWGMLFAQSMAKALRAPGVSLLALPRPPERLVGAVQTGRAAQREVSAQLFASNAIRKFRASYGEPTAIISAHRCAGAPGGGELRVSLSSPFAAKEAEGFRCPLYPYETVHEVASMLLALLRDCRVSDVRVMSGVHADVDRVTARALFFKDHGASPLH